LLPQIAFSLSFASSSSFSAFYNHLLRFVYQSSLSSEYLWFHPREHPLPPLLSKNGGILLGQPPLLRRLWKIKFNDSQRSTNISIHWDFFSRLLFFILWSIILYLKLKVTSRLDEKFSENSGYNSSTSNKSSRMILCKSQYVNARTLHDDFPIVS